MKFFNSKILLILIFILSGCSSKAHQNIIPIEANQTPVALEAGVGNADVLYVIAEQIDGEEWEFFVTINHPDKGWDDYSDGWDVMLLDGTVLKTNSGDLFTRELAHPHVNEQPFTRSQKIIIPADQNLVIVRVHDNVDGFGGKTVTVNLNISSGDMFEVIRKDQKFDTSYFASIAPSLDGNHYISGKIDMLNSKIVDIPLQGIPEWVVGMPINDGMLWFVSLENGEIQVFEVDNSGKFDELSESFKLIEGMPPAIVTSPTAEYDLLNNQIGDLSPYSYPIYWNNGLFYISEFGELIFQSEKESTTFDANALLDGRIIIDGNSKILFLSEPTSEYGHGILGDELEAKKINIISIEKELNTFSIPEGQVIESLTPIWVDMDQDGNREIILTLSDEKVGARLTMFSESGEIEAQSLAIGTGYRWRHQIAVAPFGPNGEMELVDVLTPHLGGVVEFFQLEEGGNLTRVAQVPGYSSHVIGSRNLEMAIAADVNADNRVEVLLPNQQMTSLAAIQRTEDGAEVIWEIPLNSRLTTNIASIPVNDSLILALGLKQGILRIFMP